ncbi:putative RNA-binding protein [Phytophthora cinnamomi]|uniref:putative RNA-binding protein n=1 Tax=Phytophthora cinnamomi TaxID=4785 RepID=UPI003559D3CB|nr:putative RNA-binding protein [Phytophthora cinnamomi]
MDGDDREFLREWLIRSLEPVCDADPEVLSKYVLALVQNDPQKPGLQDTCVAKLEEFLGDETAGFVARLFKALADGSYKASANASRANSDAPSDEQQSRASNGYDDDYSRRRERTPSDEEEEQRRYNKRRRDDDRSRDGDNKRHQGSPRRDSGGRRQPYPSRDMRGGPMGGRGPAPYGMGGDRRRNFPPEWGMPPQGMWPPHFPPPRGAGYPPDFDPNVYMAENGGMMPPPHMMMPHPMGGRGQFYPPGGRGGRGGRGNFYAGRGGKDGENGEATTAKTTLHVRHVDPKYVNMTMLSLHFSKFGNVVNVQMRPSAKCAFVQYATEEEAKKAFHSPLPVCNNRFISVKWARHDAQGPEEAADQSEGASKEASGEDGAPANGNAAEKSADGASTEAESPAALPEHNMTAEELRAAALEKGRKVLEQKRELLEKQRALKKQKEALIKRQLAQQKELLERMSANSSQFSIAEKRDLLNKITALSAELKALTPRHSAISPTAATRPAEEGEGSENLNGLKAELSALEAEASGGRGGRGGQWSAGRGYRGGRGGRGRGGFGRGSHTLDNRTTIVKVANLPEEARDPILLTQHFGNFGSVERVVMDERAPGQGFIKFQDRYAGQAALNHGTMFGDKQLEMGWVESQEAPAELTRTDSPTAAAAASAGVEAGDGAVAAASSDQVFASA